MYAPRIITLLICLALTSVTAAVFSDFGFFTIPLPLLKWVVVGTMAFFSMSAVVMYIGLTDAKKTSDGELRFGTSLRGKMMGAIMRHGRCQSEKHCCDVYIDTSLMTAQVMLCVAAILIFVALATVHTLAFFLCILATVALIGFIGIIIISVDNGHLDWMSRSFSPPESVVRILNYIGIGALGVLGVLFLALSLYGFVYLPIESLRQLGYTLLGAVGLYFGALALLPIPAYCLGGKKLLLKTSWGQKVCPVIR